MTRRPKPQVFSSKVGGDDAERHFQQGVLLAEKRQWKDARCRFDRALEDDACDVRALAGRAWCAEQLGDAESAEQDLRRVVQLTPDSPPAHVALATFLSGQGHAQEALHLLETLLHAVGQYGPAVALRGELLLDMGRVDEAVAALQQAPGAEGALSRALLQAGRLDEAEKAAKTAVEADGDDAEKWSTLGQILYQKEQFVEAVEAFTHAVSRAGLVVHHVQRAAALVQGGQAAEALEDLTFARRNDTGGGAAHVVNLMSAMAHEGLGQAEKARHYYREWLKDVRPGEEAQADHIRKKLEQQE